jgi:DNA-binding beta-propeller fold protein YncE
VGAGSVWATASEQGFRGVYKINPATNAIADRIPLTWNVEGIAVGAGSVWVTRPQGGSGGVIRIDAHTDRVIGKPITVGVGPVPILYAAGAVFVTNTDFGGSVSRIDAHTGAVTRAWGTADDVEAFGAGSLWGIGNDEVVRIDVHTGRVIAAIPLKRAAKVAYGDGRVWAITDPRSKSSTLYEPDPRHPGTVVTIDPATNRISSAPIPYGETAAYIDVRGPVAWIGDYNQQELTRVGATER